MPYQRRVVHRHVVPKIPGLITPNRITHSVPLQVTGPHKRITG